uniref:RPGR-interacting protein 1 first C2 domain-containing protein n=1 Tax=Plectus sambesii TaxID=2011161 RepID=A0A914XNJ0_9BILA
MLKKKTPSSSNFSPSPAPIASTSSAFNISNPVSTITGRGGYAANEQVSQPIQHNPERRTPDIDEQLLMLENKKLKDATQSLIAENLKLKDQVSHLEKLKREGAAREPSWSEAKQLILMVTLENDYLIKHIRTEQNHLRDLKVLQVTEIQQLSEQLEECQLNRSMLEQKYQAVRFEYDKLQAEVKLMTEDLSQVVPIEDHQESIRRCQTMLNDLRALYHKELASLNENADASHSQLRALCLEVAKLGAELAESKRRNDLLQKECSKLRVAQTALQSELSAAVQSKVQAESTLRELLGAFEKRNLQKNGYHRFILILYPMETNITLQYGSHSPILSRSLAPYFVVFDNQPNSAFIDDHHETAIAVDYNRKGAVYTYAEFVRVSGTAQVYPYVVVKSALRPSVTFIDARKITPLVQIAPQYFACFT